MLTKENGFELPLHWKFPDANKYAFAFIALFVFLIVIYSNSFQGQFVFDDTPNIVENSNIHLKSIDWPAIKKTFYGIEGSNINRPFSYFSFALNYHFGGLNVFGYHLVNFMIHYMAAIFLFLFIFNTLKLPAIRERYGQAAYGIALLATIFWATSPLQVTAITYIVQRMASMVGLFYIMAMYFYLKGRTAVRTWNQLIFLGLCLLSAFLSVGSKQNAVLLPFSIWLFDLLCIQGATRENIIRNLKIFVPVAIVAGAVGLWYVDIGTILSGAAYENRPFTITERLLTQPRIIIFYITLLFYPLGSRLTLLHDIELSTSLIAPWTTIPAIVLILGLIALALYLARRSPFISFAILFYFLNHAVESTLIPLELIYEHRNYIPSMFFFVPVAIAMVYVMDYFSYKKVIQFIMVAVFIFLLSAQGHTVLKRNTLFANPVMLWTDNVEKAPNLSRPYNNLGSVYANLRFHNKAYELHSKALSLDRFTNFESKAFNLQNLGLYHLYITGEYDKALGLFQSALEIYPGFGPAYHSAAICFIRKNDLPEAENRLKAALSIWPDSANLLYSYGFVLLKMGKYEQSAKEAQQAMLLNPELSEALGILGVISLKKGNDRTATYFWERYIEKNPNDIQGNLALIELYARQKKKDELSRTIGKVMVLKGSMSWRELLDQLVRDTNRMLYTPDPEAMISIIRYNLAEQLRR